MRLQEKGDSLLIRNLAIADFMSLPFKIQFSSSVYAVFHRKKNQCVGVKSSTCPSVTRPRKQAAVHLLILGSTRSNEQSNALILN